MNFNGWYFQGDDGEDGPMFMIVSKKFWDANECIDDNHISTALVGILPAGFYEVCESMFQASMSMSAAKLALASAGFAEKDLF